VNKLLGRAGFLRTSRPRDDAKLLHHAEVVSHRPVLHDFPISDTHEINEFHRHLLAGWGDAHKLTLMSTMKGLTRRNLVTFGHYVLYGEIRIREGLTKHGCELLDTLTVRRHSRRALWFTNSGEQISSKASILPGLCTSSTKRRTRALFASAYIIWSSLYSLPGALMSQHTML
jgi:hypothetical protein